MTTPWPALEKGSGVLKSAASAWRDFAVVTTPSPWALVKAEPPEPRAAILATDLKRETLESLRERVRGASMIVGVGSGLSMASLGLVTGSLQWLRTMPALVGVLTYEHIPFAVLILVSSLQAIPQDKINAARLLGAGVPRIFFTLILPLTMPGLVASAILVFSLSASSYLVPILIGAQRITPNSRSAPTPSCSVVAAMGELTALESCALAPACNASRLPATRERRMKAVLMGASCLLHATGEWPLR